ncbi:hypothetical protein BCR42DRAFT_425863 [Absidia repens]|uniref:Membrane anchor Opy2 N-terminal domain-containing protein n=1 Tax=Absidia repens TaxID=90262 RepID=A0A1X2I3G8_9FUNG|nr:hypothetical protein BCR42DRAFT_425863 [Absidia repens]
MMIHSFITICVFFVAVVTSQHTTSVRFSPVPQPTSSGIACIQMVCPTDSPQPSCPSDCSSGCKYVPDQCCPQVSVAVCDGGTSISAGVSSTSPSPSATATATNSLPLSSSSSFSTSSLSSSASASASPKPNSSTYLKPAVYSTLALMIAIGAIIV